MDSSDKEYEENLDADTKKYVKDDDNEEDKDEDNDEDGDEVDDKDENKDDDDDEDEDEDKDDDDDNEDEDNEDEENEDEENEDDDDDEDEDKDEDEKKIKKTHKKSKSKKVIQQLESILISPSIISNLDEKDDDYDSETDEEDYLIKFDNEIKRDHIIKYHPELLQSNYDEISALTKVVHDKDGVVIDPLHTTLPFLTKFEKARIIGLRAKQINNGAEPFIDIPDNILEGYIIAEMELKEKKIPFIIVRPLPNGKKEYWKLEDLELIDY